MTGVTKEILKRALRLDPIQRAQLIDSLFRSFDAPDLRIYADWDQEAESRIDGYETGQIKSDSAETVFARIAKR